MDAGYACAAHILNCHTKHQVRLITPVRGDHSHQVSTDALTRIPAEVRTRLAHLPSIAMCAAWHLARNRHTAEWLRHHLHLSSDDAQHVVDAATGWNDPE